MFESSYQNKTPAQDNTARREGLYTLFWLFVGGSAAGFVSETLWCLLLEGRLAWRSSLILGPFTLVYGLGAVALYLLLRQVRPDRYGFIFFIGVLSGTVVEFLFSWGQERLFGMVSWDYSHLAFNIDGRVCLLYSFFWGWLALLWVRYLQPRTLAMIARIPPISGRQLAGVLAAVLIALSLLSAAAVRRWTLRLDGAPAEDALEIVLDHYFSDEVMETVYDGRSIPIR